MSAEIYRRRFFQLDLLRIATERQEQALARIEHYQMPDINSPGWIDDLVCISEWQMNLLDEAWRQKVAADFKLFTKWTQNLQFANEIPPVSEIARHVIMDPYSSVAAFAAIDGAVHDLYAGFRFKYQIETPDQILKEENSKGPEKIVIAAFIFLCKVTFIFPKGDMTEDQFCRSICELFNFSYTSRIAVNQSDLRKQMERWGKGQWREQYFEKIISQILPQLPENTVKEKIQAAMAKF